MPEKTPMQVTSVSAEFAGPIPHPAILEQYDRVVPGSAERILAMAERQSAHRIELEGCVIRSDIRKSERGQWFGLIVALSGLAAAVALGIAGHGVAGGIIGSVDLVALVGIFVYGRKQKTKTLAQAKGQRS